MAIDIEDQYVRRLEELRSKLLATLHRNAVPQAESDDIVQLTILSLLRRRAVLEQMTTSQLTAYAKQAAVFTSRKIHRSASRRARLDAAWLSNFPLLEIWGQAPTARIELHEALCGLEQELRDVVVACRLLGLSNTQAAAALGLPVGTVKSRLRKAVACFSRKQVRVEADDQ